MARILILSYTPFANEPRALKQVQYLRGIHDVTTAGFGPSPFPDTPHIEIPEAATYRFGVVGRLAAVGLLLVRWYAPLRWLNALDRVTTKLIDKSWDIVIAHDLKTLDVALALKPRHGVIIDLHEYAPRQAEHSKIWRLLVAPYFRWMCRTTVHRAAATVTVSQGIVDEYARCYGIESTLIVNATPFHDLTPTPVTGPIRLVHSGGVAVQRRLDIMIRAVLLSQADVTLDLYLMPGDDALMAELQTLAEGDPRIRFREPVAYKDLIATLNKYDVGISIFPPTTFNLAWCLPNKFFDFVQARLGEIVGPSPEMARIVEEHGLGIVLPDFEPSTLARALDTLTLDQVAAFKSTADKKARALASESQAPIWEDLVGRVLTNERP